jgi:hypothetical protein
MVRDFHAQFEPVDAEHPFMENGIPLTSVTAVPLVLTVPVATFPKLSLVVKRFPPDPAC